MTKTPTPTEQSKKQRDNIKTPPKNYDYTTISDRLRTVSWSNNVKSLMSICFLDFFLKFSVGVRAFVVVLFLVTLCGMTINSETLQWLKIIRTYYVTELDLVIHIDAVCQKSML